MPTFKLTLNSTVAAMIALLCAYALGWPHPWWAPMTVWLVIQPNQKLMKGRILARSLGSSIGSIIGALLILFLTPMSLQLLGLWLLISSGLGSLFQQYRNYVFVVSGYTAAIVIMFCYFDNNLDIKLAYTRIFCTIIGVVFCSLLVLPFAPKVKHNDVFKNLWIIQEQINDLFRKASDSKLENKIQFICFELKNINKYFQFHQAFTKKGINPETLYSLIQQLSLIQGFARAEIRTYFLEKQKRISIHSIPLKNKLRYFFKYLLWHPQALQILYAIVRVMGVYLITLTLWFTTDWKNAPLMVMTAILFAALFSSHAHAQQALTDVLKGSLLGAIFGLIYRIFIIPMHDFGWEILALFMVLLLGAYLMNRTKTAKMAIDLNMTFLLIAQPFAQVNQQTPEIFSQCLAILSGIAITFIWFKYGVSFLFKVISPNKNFIRKLFYTLKSIDTYHEFIYIASLIRAELYTKILEENQTPQQLKAALLVLKQISIVEVKNLPPHTFKKSDLQALVQVFAWQHYLQYSLVQGEQSHVS
ncbi:FUSC family protein [Acinetobacter baumannii]|uniref:FUSC family protein n=1 Tax=Acinetobacter baumannii TaxID=470 RepID=UPI003AF94749